MTSRSIAGRSARSFSLSLPRCMPLRISAHAVAGALMSMAVGFASAPAFAADAAAPAAATAAGAGRHSYAIDAGALGDAISRFAAAAGVTVQADARLVEGKRSPGLSGNYSVPEALAGLLVGTRLRAMPSGQGTWVLQEAPATGADGSSSSAPLPTVSVNADATRENPLGPVSGYVATRSVSATKTDTSLLETPQSISVIGREQMNAQAVQNVGEALRYTTGVLAEEYGGNDMRIDRFMVRGFSSTMPYLDGLSTASRYTLLSENVDTFGLERVEVLLGPSSVLYGQNVPGGLVSLVSKRPTETPFGEISLQTGSYGRVQTAVDFGGPIGNDGTLFYRLTGLTRDAGTQTDDVGTKRYYLAPALTWKPSGMTSITFMAKLQRQEDGYSAQNLPAVGTLYASPNGQIPVSRFTGEPSLNFVNRTQSSVGYSLEHKFSDDWKLTQNLRWSNTSTNMGYAAAYAASGTTLSRFTLAADAWQKNIAVDTQLQGKFSTGPIRHTFLAGIDYLEARDRWAEQDGSAADLDVYAPVYGQPYTTPPYDYITEDRLRQFGVYLQDQLRIGRLALTGSIRKDWANTYTSSILDGTANDQHDSKFTGRAGLVYLFDNGLAPYLSYSTSFDPAIGQTRTGSPLKPTTGKQVEAGVKFQPVNSKSFVTASVYELKQQNALTADPLNPSFQVQTGEVRMRGAELSATADFGNGLKAVAGYTWLDGKITQSNDGYVGNTPKDVPAKMANLWLEQRFSGQLAGLRVGAGARFLGDRYGDDGNTLRLPSVTLFDAMLGYDIGRWSLALNARNLFNKTYVATCDDDARCSYGLERSILATATYRW